MIQAGRFCGILVSAMVVGCGSSGDSRTVPITTESNAYGPGWSAVHANSGNTDYSPVQGARDLVLA